jgi:hypothetical protein
MKDRLATSNQYDAKEVSAFIEQLGLADEAEQSRIITELPEVFFSVITQEHLATKLPTFMMIYQTFVDGQSYSWGYAEVVASRMNWVFRSQSMLPSVRALALDIAIRAAFHMNRYAAMDTCRAMVKTINDQNLALHVVPVIFKPESSFLSDVEPADCSNEAIRNAIRTIRNNQQQQGL